MGVWIEIAERAGIKTNRLVFWFEHLAYQIGLASGGNKQVIKEFAEMGVSLDAIQGLGFQSTLQVIMEHMNSLKDPSQKAALAFRVFGRSGAEAVSILRGGMERFNEIKEKMAASGASFDMFNATNVNLFNNA